MMRSGIGNSDDVGTFPAHRLRHCRHRGRSVTPHLTWILGIPILHNLEVSSLRIYSALLLSCSLAPLLLQNSRASISGFPFLSG